MPHLVASRCLLRVWGTRLRGCRAPARLLALAPLLASGRADEVGGEMIVDQHELDKTIVDEMELNDEEYRTFVGGRGGSFFENETTIPEEWNKFSMHGIMVNDGHDSNWVYDQVEITRGHMFHGKVHGFLPKGESNFAVSIVVGHSCKFTEMVAKHKNMKAEFVANVLYGEIVKKSSMSPFQIMLAISNRVLQRALWSFGCVIEAFKHCRIVLRVNGTFFTGMYKGQLLTCIGDDADGNVVPIAFAFIESDSWLWFLSWIKRAVVCERPNVCVLHDRHKGILSAVKKLQEKTNVDVAWPDPAFVAVFDQLTANRVRWHPYTAALTAARASRGLSMLCYRDQIFWFIKRHLVFDIFVEPYYVYRVGRQLGLRQEFPLPRELVDTTSHLMTRKGQGVEYEAT
ncbi:uncharacterized protein C2845_PM06G31950 [Panicum miliaceum]|uniref:MULE transposase domain-containing protein n=1 Tax=Panicum miliaceum TaxID=4540 RepID=A0A3L6R739_PANMI|nr:uncharacterized protein C2845_PM06G31950 [Panicum miliaceum]